MGEPAEALGQGEWQEEIEERADAAVPAPDPCRREPGQPMVLIGLAGKAGVGKDTVAEAWWQDHDILRAAFANPIKHGLATMLGLSLDLFYDREVKEEPIAWLGKSPRELMQSLGTEWGRAVLGDDIWLRVAQGMSEHLLAAPEFGYAPALVYTDVRMDNEADWIRERGGWIVHIVRPDAPSVATHNTEAGVQLKPGDLVIRNVSTLEHLYQVADTVFRSIIETEQFLAEVASSELTEVREDDDPGATTKEASHD